jgi:hypothetical protein
MSCESPKLNTMRYLLFLVCLTLGCSLFSQTVINQDSKNVSIIVKPNPANLSINVLLFPNFIGKVVIQDLSGKIRYSQDLVLGKDSAHFVDVSMLKKGMHFVQVAYEDKKITTRLIIK